MSRTVKVGQRQYRSGLGRRGTLLCAALLVAATGATAQDSLRRMSEKIEDLTRKVSPAVVKVLVTGYGPVEENGQQQTGLIARQRSIGSGAIVDASGYIVTNNHVVEGAQQVRVVMTAPPEARPTTRARILNARIVGVDENTDLAVLKVEATGLPTLPLGDYRKLRQGQLVLAFGSPEGLQDTVTMGLVSSVMRQPDPDQPMIYIQTDAAINPGNSGGPLVDVDGNLVGINTFILSESGGNEGIGFAIPSVIVRFVYNEILAHGHVHQRVIGAHLQAITPALAAGLKLPQDWGIIVADLLPGGPAASAGLKIDDIVLSVDGAPVDGLPLYRAALYRSPEGSAVTLEVRRGSQKLTLKVPVLEEQQGEFDDLAALVNPQKSLVAPLGILGIEINDKIAKMIEGLRLDSGVLVVAKAAGGADSGLSAGDVIHSLNGAPVTTLDGLREALKGLKSGDAVAMQVEREGRLSYLAFEME